MTKIEREIERLNKRVAAHEPVARFMIHVQLDQLTKAERLRKLVKELTRPVGTRTPKIEVSKQAFVALRSFAEELVPFSKPVKHVPLAVRKIAAEMKKEGRI
jgi:hypothetical protein